LSWDEILSLIGTVRQRHTDAGTQYAYSQVRVERVKCEDVHVSQAV
jgi:hypothetical protein